MATPKKRTDKTTATKGFEVEAGTDNPEVQAENAVMADDQVEDTQTEAQPERKGVSLYIDPLGEKTTAISFVLNDQAITLQTIKDKVDEFDKITINGFLDKKNYELVKKAKSELLKTRTTLAKVAKADVIDPINSWVKTYKENLAVITDALQTGQDKMEAKLKEIDDAFTLEQERIEKEAQDRIQGRVSGLFNLGAMFNEDQGFYTFPYNSGLIINSVQLKDWDDAEYGAFIDEVVDSWNTDQARIRQEEEEAEQEKLRILNLAKEQEIQKTALVDKMIKLRHKELKLAGAEFVGDRWMVRGEAIDPDWITGFDDGRWDDLIAEIENPTITDQPADHTVEYKGQVAGDSDIESTAEEAVASFSGDNQAIHEAHAQQPSDVEGDVITDIEFEEAESLEHYDVTLSFTTERPFKDHWFKNTTLRMFPPEFEGEANDGIAPAELMDAGNLGDTGMQYLLIKRPK